MNITEKKKAKFEKVTEKYTSEINIHNPIVCITFNFKRGSYYIFEEKWSRINYLSNI